MIQETNKKIRAVHFGAGNIGRGLIAQIYQENKLDLVFIDKNPENLKNFEKFEKYDINFFDDKESITIKNFNLFIDDNDKKVVRWLRKATIVSTSIGANNLDSILPYFEMAYKDFELDHNVQIICFENGNRISSEFKKKLRKLINRNENVSFLDVVVDRIVPIQKNDDWSIKTESFYEIVADGNQHHPRSWLSLEGIKYNRNLDAYIHRKLILVNAVHTLIGLLGHDAKLKYISEALETPSILRIIHQYQRQAIEALAKEYPEEFNKEDLQEYARKTMKRFKNPELMDTNERVIRNPITKLGQNERYMLALDLALKHNVEHKFLLVPFMLLLNLDLSKDTQCKELKESIKIRGIKSTLLKYSSVNEEVVKGLFK